MEDPALYNSISNKSLHSNELTEVCANEQDMAYLGRNYRSACWDICLHDSSITLHPHI